MMPTGVTLLEFNPALNPRAKKPLRDGLSGIVQVGTTLWVANDETVSLERLTYQGTNPEGVYQYGHHAQFALQDYLRLPVPSDDDAARLEEADVEGIDYGEEYLWIVSSHSRKRKQAETHAKPEENVKHLAQVRSDGNRFLLARIPLVEEQGAYVLRKTVEGHGKRLVAAQLRGNDKRNDLLKALKQDEHLQAFLAIPGKENGVDIEGLAVVGKRLFIGLRGPVLRGWAILLEVEPVPKRKDPSTLKLKRIGSDKRPYRKHFLQLGGLGIRDLCVQGEDLLILAGPTMDLDGPVTVFRWSGGATPHADGLVADKHLTTVLDVPYGHGERQGRDHAEGMALFAPEGGTPHALLVVYDAAAAERLAKGPGSVEADMFSL